MATAEMQYAAAAVVCHGLVKVYRSATGETHALRGIDLSVLRGVRDRGGRAVGQRQEQPAAPARRP